LFDTFGTVVDWRSGISREVAAFFLRHGIAVDADVFSDEWRRRYEPAMEPIRSGSRPFVRLDILHHENLEGSFRHFGIDPARFSPDEISALNLAWHRLDPWPDVLDGLQRLAASFLIAPLSNGNVSLLTNMAKRAKLPWDCILGAEVVRRYKPDPRCYLETADVLGLEPEQCVMVAAHNDDLAAAAATGMRTAFVVRPQEHGPGQDRDLHPEGPWDFICQDFIELSRVCTPEFQGGSDVHHGRPDAFCSSTRSGFSP
jgi:2-haloacid dehalogenase